MILHSLETDKVIAGGLIVALLLGIIGDIIITLITGTASPIEQCSKEIVIGLAGYMGRGGVNKIMQNKEG